MIQEKLKTIRVNSCGEDKLYYGERKSPKNRCFQVILQLHHDEHWVLTIYTNHPGGDLVHINLIKL